MKKHTAADKRNVLANSKMGYSEKISKSRLTLAPEGALSYSPQAMQIVNNAEISTHCDEVVVESLNRVAADLGHRPSAEIDRLAEQAVAKLGKAVKVVPVGKAEAMAAHERAQMERRVAIQARAVAEREAQRLRALLEESQAQARNSR